MSQVSAISQTTQPQPMRKDYKPQKTNDYMQSDYLGALGTSGLWGTAWGAGEYVFNKKPFLNPDRSVGDKFVKSISEGFAGLNDAKIAENLKKMQIINEKIDKCATKDQIKSLIKESSELLYKPAEKDLTKLAENIVGEHTLENSKKAAKMLFDLEGKNKEYIQSVYESCLDSGGKLVHDAKKISKEKFDLVSDVISKFRKNNAIKSAISFTVMTATLLCIFEYFKGRKAKKQAQEQV